MLLDMFVYEIVCLLVYFGAVALLVGCILWAISKGGE